MSVITLSTDSLDSLETSSSASTIKLSLVTIPNYFQPQTKLVVTPSLDEPKLAVPPPLIRKKSGELVKSSLKLSSLLQRSMSSPLLAASKTPQKSVKFASRLANIKMFDGKDSPSAVSTTENSPIHSPRNETDEDYSDELRLKGLHNLNKSRSDYFQWNWSGNFKDNTDDFDLTSDTSSDDELNYFYSASSAPSKAPKTPTSYKINYHDVPTHQSNSKTVSLQSINLIQETNQNFLIGTINCKNLAFEKELTIKLTLNHWETNLNFSSNVISYNKSLPHLNVDQFKFRIPLSDCFTDRQRYNKQDVNIQLCIKYSVNNHTYWDNNNNRNYHITLRPVSSIKIYNYSANNKSSNTTKASTTKKDDEFPQFDELVSKLISFQKSTIPSNNEGAPKLFVTPTKKSSLHSRYNSINDELEVDLNSKPRSTPPPPSFPIAAKETTPVAPRPGLAYSYSTSDIFGGSAISGSTPKKYSQSYKVKQQKNKENTATSVSNSNLNSTFTSSDNLKFNSLSYTDLLANYCFSGSPSVSTAALPITTKARPADIKGSTISMGHPIASSCSSDTPTPASAFHSFSDSIHI